MRKILVVDGDYEIRNLINEIVRDCYCFDEVFVVMGINGQDGWREFKENRPDLVITDLEMESPDAGIILAQKIKTISPVTPVIMISGAKVDAEKIDSIDFFLSKPFEIDVLAKAIRRALARDEVKK